MLEDIIFYKSVDQSPKYEISQRISFIKSKIEISEHNELNVTKKRLNLLEQNFINNQVL